MDKEKYICRKCGFEFIAIPGEEEPPECPECESDEIERLERATVGRTSDTRCAPGKKRFS
jgi:DNA-directed RNA polymerase subunit RPC12/RpoP